MSEFDFQREMLNQLKDLAVGQAAIGTDVAAMKEHLRVLNGKVASHEKQLNERQNQCPLVDILEARIRPIEDHVVAELAEEKANTSWMRRLWPFIWAAAGAIAILILLHSADLLKFKP